MNLYRLLITALRSLSRHKMRSLLTTLGIIVGVVAIIAVMSIGEGAKYKVKQQIDKLGTNFIIVLGASPKRMISRGSPISSLNLKQSDLDAIVEESEYIDQVSPGAQKPIKAQFEGSNWQTLAYGVNEKYLDIRQWELERGELFSKQDVVSGRKVVLIGQTVKKELFGQTDPVGKTIRIKKMPFKVIGILEEKGKLPDGRDEDDVMIMPITTLQRKIMGVHSKRFAVIILSAKSKETMDQASSDIKAILRQQHKLRFNEEDDFTVFSQNDIAQASESASAVLNLLLLIIASISLIVGGIGIMNIMLVTVSERTKEIGIRMAIGATTQAILNQFIIEAVVICLFGGLLGITFGVTIAKLVGVALGWPIFISNKAILISLVSSVLIGLFFGYYPAKQASRLNPVDALLADQ